jgi:hypothetical protein
MVDFLLTRLSACSGARPTVDRAVGYAIKQSLNKIVQSIVIKFDIRINSMERKGKKKESNPKKCMK